MHTQILSNARYVSRSMSRASATITCSQCTHKYYQMPGTSRGQCPKPRLPSSVVNAHTNTIKCQVRLAVNVQSLSYHHLQSMHTQILSNARYISRSMSRASATITCSQCTHKYYQMPGTSRGQCPEPQLPSSTVNAHTNTITFNFCSTHSPPA